MALKAVFFDLDGTLLPMDYNLFIKTYFDLLGQKMASFGYEPEALVQSVWKGIHAMVKNDGTRTNEDIFWETFTSVWGEKAKEHIPVFDEFYRVDFQKVKEVCGYTPRAKELVHKCRDAGLTVVLATSPLYPAVATESRVRWAGLEPEDFDLYTTYENAYRSKPSPAYYRDLCDRIGVDPADCLMVGNDIGDDTPAEKAGMRVFVVTDNLINWANVDISCWPNGDYDALERYIDQLLQA